MTSAAVVVQNLAVNYGNYTALAGINFDLPSGSFLAVIGPNGAGKTTLIKAMVGLANPRRGSVQLLGADPDTHDPMAVSYVPQIKGIDRTFPALAVELVVSGLRKRWPWRITPAERNKAMEILERLQVGDLAERNVAELSGGQLQRIYLARGLVAEPQLVIFDEPAAGIDVPGEKQLYLLLEAYQERTAATVVMITHDWTVARHHATHVLLMNRIQIGFGPPADVLTHENLSSAFGHAGHRHPMSLDEAHE
jgi:zinc transport system ATP-binding protein